MRMAKLKQDFIQWEILQQTFLLPFYQKNMQTDLLEISKNGFSKLISEPCLAEFASYYKLVNLQETIDCQTEELLDEMNSLEETKLPRSFSTIDRKSKFVLRKVPAVIRFPAFKLEDNAEIFFIKAYCCDIYHGEKNPSL